MQPAERLAERIRAAAPGHGLWIAGAGSRRPGPPGEAVLSLSGFTGVVEYDPAELAVTVRAGTPVAALEAALAEAGQRLACEPAGPEAGTVGGWVACGQDGPGRPWLGDLRGAVLGVAMLDGRGRLLAFGGRVMKNVAGYDLFRIHCGAHGILGPLLEVSLRTRPLPPARRCLARPCGPAEALAEMTRLQGRPWPLTGLAWAEGRLHLRLEGLDAGVGAAARDIGGEEENGGFWETLRRHRHPLQREAWRLVLPPAAPLPDLPGQWLLDQGGALRWLRPEPGLDGGKIRRAAAALGGWASPWPPADPFAPLPPPLLALHRRLKRAFDPRDLFNPGLLRGGE